MPVDFCFLAVEPGGYFVVQSGLSTRGYHRGKERAMTRRVSADRREDLLSGQPGPRSPQFKSNALNPVVVDRVRGRSARATLATLLLPAPPLTPACRSSAGRSESRLLPRADRSGGDGGHRL